MNKDLDKVGWGGGLGSGREGRRSYMRDPQLSQSFPGSRVLVMFPVVVTHLFHTQM